MCFLTIWKYKPSGCGHTMMWRDSCDDDNPYCCQNDDCYIDAYRMKGKCRLCRKADIHRLAKEIEDHEQLRRALSLEALGVRAGELLLDPETSNEDTEALQNVLRDADRSAQLLKVQLKTLQEMKVEYHNMEQIEDVKLREQIYASLIITGMIKPKSRAEFERARWTLRDRRPSPLRDDIDGKAEDNAKAEPGDKVGTESMLGKHLVDSREVETEVTAKHTDKLKQVAASCPSLKKPQKGEGQTSGKAAQ